LYWVKRPPIGQIHAEGKPAAAIARMVGLTRKTVYKAIGGLSPGALNAATDGRFKNRSRTSVHRCIRAAKAIHREASGTERG
jgi:hypothetical protein